MELSKQATEFFLYSYFEITQSEIEKDDLKKIAKKCACRAYLDLNRTLSFNDEKIKGSNKSQTDKLKAERHKAFSESISELIANYVTELITKYRGKGFNQDDFDVTHNRICVCTIISANNHPINNQDKTLNKEMSYGQAQKWLNMTLKYLWLLGKCNGLEEFLHVPVDSFIMEASGKLGIEVPSKKKQNYSKYSPDSLPWSKWCLKAYCKFQKDIRDCIRKRKDVNNPIEWEGNAWIDVAHERKQKEDESNKKNAENT